MSNIDKRALREAAEKATPGRWEYYPGNTSIEYNVDSMDEDQGSIVYVDSGDFTQKQTDLNGTFIAAANPATVLALLDELEAKEEQRANWFQMAQKLGEDLDAAEKHIAELRDWNAGLAQESFTYQQRVAELDNSLCELLPGIQYMDPPDGGNVTPLEQVRRMIADYRHRIAEQQKTLNSARSYVKSHAAGDGHAFGVLQAIDRAAGIGKGE